MPVVILEISVGEWAKGWRGVGTKRRVSISSLQEPDSTSCRHWQRPIHRRASHHVLTAPARNTAKRTLVPRLHVPRTQS